MTGKKSLTTPIIKAPKTTGRKGSSPEPVEPEKGLLSDLRELIEQTRLKVSQAVNTGLVVLYWNIGTRIRKEILGNKRAEYGEKIVSALSKQLEMEYGAGFTRRNLFNMLRFAEVFPDFQIVHALSAQLTWTHFRTIIYLKTTIQRDFYAELCRIERWSARALQQKIDSMLFERTAVAKKPEIVISKEIAKLREEDKLTPNLVFRDPYVLDFLQLHDSYGEKDVEAAILREMASFLMELGAGFSFIARQKRIQIGNEDFYLDLLFYHRKLRRLIAIELKYGAFKAAYKGQMELYLRWLDKHERQPDEDSPLGIILCAGKAEEVIELLELGKSGIHVAEYLTELPPIDVLQKKLHDAITLARARLPFPPGMKANE
jgi:predicted nuclease of restriction endonuclease-like (RecB) superfamily